MATEDQRLERGEMRNNKSIPGRGVLFVNSKKTTERHPDYMGEITLDRDYGRGTTIQIAGWRKTTPKNHLISIGISQRQEQAYPKSTIQEDGDVEIPF